MRCFRSHGKLLLTAEYLVLDGAKALALPTTYGQTLKVEEIQESRLHWKSLDPEEHVWFEGFFDLQSKHFDIKNDTAHTLAKLLNEAARLNSDFLSKGHGYSVVTQLDFPQNWGLGSSSTLINNIATWADVDAYELLWNAFSGSGYDIACAQHDSPLLYRVEDRLPTVETISFDPPFKDQLFFVHLNQKQNSREAIAHYRALPKEQLANIIATIDAVTHEILACTTLDSFERLLNHHEKVMGTLLQLQPVKERLFPDFSGSVKSLGAWGGDFVLATGDEHGPAYFRSKGYDTAIPFTEMVLP